jgi:hypothetical protein
MSKFVECIIPQVGGKYHCVRDNDGETFDEIRDIINNIASTGTEIYELGADALPDTIEDIRGMITNEPTHVYAIVKNGTIGYFGIEVVD